MIRITKKIKFPEGLKTIGQSAFQNNSTLEEIILPDSLEIMEAGVFVVCKKLKSVTWAKNIRSIPLSTFQNCAFTKFTIPDVVEVIEKHAFDGCNSLTEIVLPKNVLVVGSSAFLNCTALAMARIIATSMEIAEDAFSGCTNLTDIYVPWSEDEVANAPWGAENATIHYNYTGGTE